MTDVDDIIEYIKYLRKGFDKDQFKLQVENLAQIVDTSGLDYDDFHTLFKVWLNLSIPVTKWISIGVCLVPRDRVEKRTVNYALRWLLSNYQNQSSLSRIGFLLDWLTAALDTDSIDRESLDAGYGFFDRLLSYEVLTPHAMKLVYSLTKPENVTRRRALQLLDIAKIRDNKKSKCRQIQVLLGLFKSYKPEYVPENIPAFSVHTAFRKLNVHLVHRFSRSQAQRNYHNEEKQRLLWVNPLNMKGGKKAEPLVPNMEFLNIGAKNYGDRETQKTFFDFTDPSSLVGYSVRREISRPARLRALLCNEAGMMLLATAPDHAHAFFSHDLHHVLYDCFLHTSPYSYEEKQDLLKRLARLQRTLMQGIPVVTRFLAQYLPFWNERDHFHEILELCEWLSLDSIAHIPYILRPLGRIFHRAQPLEQCAILKCLVTLYSNLSAASTRSKHYFMSLDCSQNYTQLLGSLAEFIGDLCNKVLQVNPEDVRVLYWSVRCAASVARAQWVCVAGGGRLGPATAPRLVLALPLLAPSAAPVDQLAMLMLLYKKLFSKLKSTSTSRKFEDQLWTLQAYTVDMMNCLWTGKFLSDRSSGVIFTKLHPQFVERLCKTVPKADETLDLKSHAAFAPYTYMQAGELDNKMWFEHAIDSEFANLSKFFKKALPELR